jgi:hypothetical protein
MTSSNFVAHKDITALNARHAPESNNPRKSALGVEDAM